MDHLKRHANPQHQGAGDRPHDLPWMRQYEGHSPDHELRGQDLEDELTSEAADIHALRLGITSRARGARSRGIDMPRELSADASLRGRARSHASQPSSMAILCRFSASVFGIVISKTPLLSRTLACLESTAAGRPTVRENAPGLISR